MPPATTLWPFPTGMIKIIVVPITDPDSTLSSFGRGCLGSEVSVPVGRSVIGVAI